MTHRIIRLVLLAVCAAGLTTSAAQAQSYGGRSAPLYPDRLQPGQTYAVEVAPGTYVFHRPRSRKYPYVRSTARHHVVPRHTARRYSHEGHIDRRRPAVRDSRRPHVSMRRRDGRRIVINTERIVREKPVVIEHRRVVNDPPRVVERRRYVEEVPPPRRGLRTSRATRSMPRVIHAEAEVTILGPDRMSIRLYRKRGNDRDAFDKQ